jgi:hypothetical protein
MGQHSRRGDRSLPASLRYLFNCSDGRPPGFAVALQRAVNRPLHHPRPRRLSGLPAYSERAKAVRIAAA